MKMKTAIQKAWEMNLELDEEDRFKSKEEIIHCECVCNSCFNITLDTPKYCTNGDDDEICTKCWTREIEEDVQEKNNINESELSFDKLKDCLVDELSLNELNEKEFKDLLTNNSSLIYIRSGDNFTYDNLPIISKYLMDVYNYTTELKNKIEYVDFNTAKKYMKQGKNAYYNGAKYNYEDVFTMDAIESDRWILDK